jgi:hypothetical protein
MPLTLQTARLRPLSSSRGPWLALGPAKSALGDMGRTAQPVHGGVVEWDGITLGQLPGTESRLVCSACMPDMVGRSDVQARLESRWVPTTSRSVSAAPRRPHMLYTLANAPLLMRDGSNKEILCEHEAVLRSLLVLYHCGNVLVGSLQDLRGFQQLMWPTCQQHTHAP